MLTKANEKLKLLMIINTKQISWLTTVSTNSYVWLSSRATRPKCFHTQWKFFFLAINTIMLLFTAKMLSFSSKDCSNTWKWFEKASRFNMGPAQHLSIRSVWRISNICLLSKCDPPNAFETRDRQNGHSQKPDMSIRFMKPPYFL